MTIAGTETWIQIADLNDQQKIRFTPEFQEMMGDLGWEARAFAGHLLGLWYDPLEHMSDYNSGDAKHSKDQAGVFSCNDLDGPHPRTRVV